MSTQAKLTLRLDSSLIKRAKRYAKKTGKPVSRIVADYFNLLGSENHDDFQKYPPTVRSLIGCLGKNALTKEDYKKHLEDKYL